MELFDSHAHYFDGRFFGDECPEGAASLLTRLFSEELCGVINVGTDVGTTLAAIEQAKNFPNMYVAAGVHPSDAMQYEDRAGELSALERLFGDPQNKIVALGEIGLDYHYPDTDKERQRLWFDEQLSLAEAYGLPVVIHDREAHGDCLDVLRAHPRAFGVFHSFSGSIEMARELLRRDFYISFSGTVTFKNAQKVAAVAAAMPHDRTLIETDAPYLAPHPHRGELNHSGLMRFTATRIGELWGIAPEEAASITAANARKLFLRK